MNTRVPGWQKDAHASKAGASPLTESHLNVEIDDLMAEYTLRHVFRNEGMDAIEATFSFPTPLDAAFLGMDAMLAGERRSATVVPARQAARTYDDALSDGDSAVLLELVEKGMLNVSLGNLGPGETGEITLRFAAMLGVAGGQARFVLPLVHRPRYGAYKMVEWQVPTHDFAVEHPLEAEVRVRGLLADKAVTCSMPGATFRLAEGALHLSLTRAMLDRDLVVTFALDSGLATSVRRVQDGTESFGIVTCLAPPSGGTARAPLNLCLLMDCSGSMAGDAIAQSRDALRAVAKTLTEDDRLQVIRFGTGQERMFRRPLKASPRMMAAVEEMSACMEADLGGTEMGHALEEALQQLSTTRSQAEQPVIVIVTDGAVQPWEIESAKIQATVDGVRVFVVAVGSSAGTDVLAPLALDTGGVLERAVPAESVEAGVMRQIVRARCPRPEPLKVNWGAGTATQVTPVSLYPGDAGVLVAVLGNDVPRTAKVDVAGAEGALVALTGEAADSLAWRAWAGQQVYAHAGEKDCERIALKYGLITPETSAVLVKAREMDGKLDGLPVTVVVPHMVPEGMVAAPKAGMAMSASRGIDHATLACSSVDMGDQDDHLNIAAFLSNREAEDSQSIPKPLRIQERAQAQKLVASALIELLLDGRDRADDEPFEWKAILERVPEDGRKLVSRFISFHLSPVSRVGEALNVLINLLWGFPEIYLSDEQEEFVANRRRSL